MFNFCPEIEKIVKSIAICAQKNSVSTYFVGGIVRDMLMDIKIKDIDILIEGSAIEFVNNYKEHFKNVFDININSIHKDFDTAKTVINGVDIDFASTREEDYPLAGVFRWSKTLAAPFILTLKGVILQ